MCLCVRRGRFLGTIGDISQGPFALPIGLGGACGGFKADIFEGDQI